MTKFCTACETRKPADDFYRSRGAADGRMGICKDCHRAAVTRRRRTNPAVQAYDRARAKRPARRQAAAKISTRWRQKHPEAYRAQTALGNALRDGKVDRQPCLFCGEAKVHAHHRDYSKPLEVVWLCAKCHHRLHAAFPETEAHEERAA